jgi:V8-like Glu-specific endopeptidase
MRQSRRTTAGAGAATLLISGLVAAAQGPAQADPGGSQRGVVAHSTGVATPVEARRVRDYWTPQRQAQALPLSGEMTASTLLGAQGKSKDKPPKPSKPGKTADSSGDFWTDGGRVSATTGKVFFVLGGGQYTCSAGVVESDNASTVVTAGHCLHDGAGSFAEKWFFVPGYRDTSPDNPYGDWVASELFTTEKWASEGDTDYDVGMAVVSRVLDASPPGADPADRVADVVGAQRIGFDQDPSPIHAFGYPTNKSFKGNRLVFCSGTPTREPDRSTAALRLTCDMGSGSSGGPWLEDFDPATGLGTQVAVTSFGYTDDKKGIYGPFFGAEVREVYQQAQSAPVG